jgi:hypothetical protein
MELAVYASLLFSTGNIVPRSVTLSLVCLFEIFLFILYLSVFWYNQTRHIFYLSGDDLYHKSGSIGNKAERLKIISEIAFALELSKGGNSDNEDTSEPLRIESEREMELANSRISSEAEESEHLLLYPPVRKGQNYFIAIFILFPCFLLWSHSFKYKQVPVYF